MASRLLFQRCWSQVSPHQQQRFSSRCFTSRARTTATTISYALAGASRRHFYSSPLRCKIVPFHLADIGEGITECELIQWFVAPGAQIQQFDKICEVQSDKATVEITSRYDGTVAKLHYKAGDIAKVGQPLIDIDTQAKEEETPKEMAAAGSSGTSPTAVPTTAPPSLTGTAPQSLMTSADTSEVFATPAVRRIARENNVKLSQVRGTGKAGRITKEDILIHVGAVDGSHRITKSPVASSSSSPGAAAVPPSSPFQAAGTKTSVKLTPIQKAMVKSMNSSLKIPHFGFSDTIRLDALKKVRADVNRLLKDSASSALPEGTPSKLSYMPFLIKSFSLALRDFPLLNAQFVESTNPPELVYRADHNIGIAVDTPGGLTVPVVHGADRMSILEIGTALQSLTDKAKRNQLAPSAFQNTTITISNIGNIAGGVLGPVIPPDTVCIVAIGKSKEVVRLVKNDKTERGYEVVAEEEMTVSFSADHRVVDGATVARFFVAWKALVEHPARMALWMK